MCADYSFLIHSLAPVRVVFLAKFRFDHTSENIRTPMQCLSWITEPSIWGKPGDAHLPGNCSRYRQSRVHYDRNRQPAGTRSAQSPSRRLMLALLTRVLLLFCISWLTTLTAPWLYLFGRI